MREEGTLVRDREQQMETASVCCCLQSQTTHRLSLDSAAELVKVKILMRTSFLSPLSSSLSSKYYFILQISYYKVQISEFKA